MKEYLGAVKIDSQSTTYIFELNKELDHWQSGEKLIKNQNGVSVDVSEEIKNLICEIKEGLEKEKAFIKREVLAVYPDAKGFDLGDGVAYVWRE